MTDLILSPTRAAKKDLVDNFGIPEAAFGRPSFEKLNITKDEFVKWLNDNGVRKTKKPKPYKATPSYYD